MRHLAHRMGLLCAMLLVAPLTTTAIRSETAQKPELPRNAEDGGSLPKSIQQRSEAIEHELAGLPNHPWAGSYYEGDGLGANIRLLMAPDHGVTATWHGCMGLYGANEGLVAARADGSLQFDFLWRNQETFGGFAEQLLPVTWGERHYLVSTQHLLDFVDAINTGDEPRQQAYGMFLLRAGDEDKPTAGLPNLSAQYLALLRTEPAEFAVTSVEALPPVKNESLCTRRFRLHFASNGDRQLQVGGSLRVVEPKDTFESLKVTSIEGNAAVAEFEQYADDGCRFDDAVPTRRWRLQAPGHRIDATKASRPKK